MKIKLNRFPSLFGLLLVLSASSVLAQDVRLEELEKKVAVMQIRLDSQPAPKETPKRSEPQESKRGGTPVLTSNSEKLDLSGYIQVRYLWTEGGLSAKNKNVAEKKAFDDTKARLKLQGKLDATTEYRFQLEVTQTKQFQLIDAWVSREFNGERLEFLMGQFQPKTQGNGDIANRQFMDVSNSSDTNSAEQRDRGLAVSGLLFNKTFTYEWTLVNGNGIDAAAHDDTGFRRGLLLKFEPQGKLGLYQNDIEKSTLRFAFASAYARERQVSTVVGHQKREWLVSTIQCKWNGLYAKLLHARQEVDKSAGVGKDQVYRSIQAGYAFRLGQGRMMEPVFRFEDVNKNRATDNQTERSTTLGFNYYLKGNTSRLQFNYISKKEQGLNKTPNNTFKAGMAIMF